MLKLDKLAKGNTFAKSGIESALLDAQGKRLGLPVSELLGGRVRDSLEVAWTLASGDTARDIAEAQHMLDIQPAPRVQAENRRQPGGAGPQARGRDQARAG